MTQRRVILVRPQYRGTNFGSTSNPPTPSHAHVRAAERSTTTNVVSVERVAVHGDARSHAHASDVTDFAHRIKQLSAKDRKALLDTLLLEQQLDDGPPAARDVAMWAEAVHREFTQAVGSADGGLVGPGVVRKAVQVGTSWKPVLSFMQSSKLMELSVTERQRAYYMLAQMLVRHARSVARHTGTPLTLKLVCNCTGALAGLFDNAFPGYLEAGLAKVIARQAA